MKIKCLPAPRSKNPRCWGCVSRIVAFFFMACLGPPQLRPGSTPRPPGHNDGREKHRLRCTRSDSACRRPTRADGAPTRRRGLTATTPGSHAHLKLACASPGANGPARPQNSKPQQWTPTHNLTNPFTQLMRAFGPSAPGRTVHPARSLTVTTPDGHPVSAFAGSCPNATVHSRVRKSTHPEPTLIFKKLIAQLFQQLGPPTAVVGSPSPLPVALAHPMFAGASPGVSASAPIQTVYFSVQQQQLAPAHNLGNAHAFRKAARSARASLPPPRSDQVWSGVSLPVSPKFTGRQPVLLSLPSRGLTPRHKPQTYENRKMARKHAPHLHQTPYRRPFVRTVDAARSVPSAVPVRPPFCPVLGSNFPNFRACTSTIRSQVDVSMSNKTESKKTESEKSSYLPVFPPKKNIK